MKYEEIDETCLEEDSMRFPMKYSGDVTEEIIYLKAKSRDIILKGTL